MENLVKSIIEYNKGRNSVGLELKYNGMYESLFRFYRGTNNLFYQYFKLPTIAETPLVWACGDLHLENFGAFKADNDLVYFDLNDFDEALLMPVTYELTRVLVSLQIAAEQLKATTAQTKQLCELFLNRYLQTMINGKSLAVERTTAKGMLKYFLKKVEKRSTKQLIKDRTEKKGDKLRLLIDNKHTTQLTKAQKTYVAHLVDTLNVQLPVNKRYTLIDTATRIAGTGSLGLERYVVLAQRANTRKYCLVDIKLALTSAALPYIEGDQPAWLCEAQRVVEVQRMLQYVPHAALEYIQDGDKSFVVKELQPIDDKMDITLCAGNIEKLETFIGTLAELTASAHLRSSGRKNSAIADDLITFAQNKKWVQPLLAYVDAYSNTIKQQYKIYCKAYKEERELFI